MQEAHGEPFERARRVLPRQGPVGEAFGLLGDELHHGLAQHRHGRVHHTRPDLGERRLLAGGDEAFRLSQVPVVPGLDGALHGLEVDDDDVLDLGDGAVDVAGEREVDELQARADVLGADDGAAAAAGDDEVRVPHGRVHVGDLLDAVAGGEVGAAAGCGVHGDVPHPTGPQRRDDRAGVGAGTDEHDARAGPALDADELEGFPDDGPARAVELGLVGHLARGLQGLLDRDGERERRVPLGLRGLQRATQLAGDLALAEHHRLEPAGDAEQVVQRVLAAVGVPVVETLPERRDGLRVGVVDLEDDLDTVAGGEHDCAAHARLCAGKVRQPIDRRAGAFDGRQSLPIVLDGENLQ